MFDEKSIPKVKKLLKAEPIIIAIAFIGLCFYLMHWDGASILLIIGINTLAITTLFGVFIPSEKISDFKSTLINKIGSISLSIALIGILFKIMIWEGSKMQLTLGLVGIGCTLITILYLRNQVAFENAFSPKLILRLFLVGTIATFLTVISDHDIMSFNHKNDPEYVRLFFKMKDNPHDTAARNAFQNYRKAKLESDRKTHLAGGQQ